MLTRGYKSGAVLKKAPKILGVCNPLIDFTLNVDDQKYLDKYQIKAGNAILADQPIHKQLLKDIWEQCKTDMNITIAPGGSGLNTMRAINVRILCSHMFV